MLLQVLQLGLVVSVLHLLCDIPSPPQLLLPQAAREDHLEKAADEAVFTLGEDGMEEICEWESGGSAEEGGGLVESDGEAPGAGDGEPPGAGASARTEDATPQEATSRQPVPAAGSTAQSPARFEEELEC